MVAHLRDPDYAEWVTNLVQDLGAEASLCKLVLKGISNCAWKPRNLVRHCAKGQGEACPGGASWARPQKG